MEKNIPLEETNPKAPFPVARFQEGATMDDWQQEGQQPQVASLDDFEQYRITKEKYIPHPEPIITIGGEAVASRENLTGISAASKAGKTAFTGVTLAGGISQTGDVDGFSALAVVPNLERKAVIHFDSEQSRADQQDLVNTILKRAKYEKTPDFFQSYNIRQLNLSNYKGITSSVCELSSQQFGGIHLIVVDGGADYITSVNDEEAANDIVQYFISLSIQYNCPIIVIVHLNPGSEKERGHFGSQVQRKCFGLITITKEGDISIAEPKFMRKAKNGDIPSIHFTFCKEKGYHVQVESATKEDVKSVKELETLRKIATEIFAPPTSSTHKEAIAKLMKRLLKAESTAKTLLSKMTNWGILEHDNKHYRLKMNDMPEEGQGSK